MNRHSREKSTFAPRALVCGGGIAGNTAALQLLRARIPTTVVERTAAPRPGGQAVDLRGPAGDVATRMGLMPAIRAHQLDERGMIFVDAAGRELNRMPADLFGGEGIVAEIEITRGDLNQVLLDAIAGAGGDLEYRYGDWVSELHQDADGVDVTFASGVRERFSLVIGADGLHSSLRRLVFGADSQFLKYLGGYMSFFTMPTPASKHNRLEWFVTHQVAGGSFVGIRSDVDPTTSKAVVILRMPPDPALERSPTQQKQLIRKRLSAGGWEIPAILNAMEIADDFYFDELARVTMPTWSERRIVLLGDAAFCGSPLTGQGTSVAMIGAYVLAGEIAATPTHPAQAISRYETLVRPLIAKAQELMPGGVRALTPGSAVEMAISRLINRAVTSRPMRPLMTRLVSTTVTYRVPDYEPASSAPIGLV